MLPSSSGQDVAPRSPVPSLAKVTPFHEALVSKVSSTF